VEQTLRAKALAERAGTTTLLTQDLSAKTLTAAIDSVTTEPAALPKTDGLNGAKQTVTTLRNLLESRT
jgi:predicted glycosyltransferase